MIIPKIRQAKHRAVEDAVRLIRQRLGNYHKADYEELSGFAQGIRKLSIFEGSHDLKR